MCVCSLSHPPPHPVISKCSENAKQFETERVSGVVNGQQDFGNRAVILGTVEHLQSVCKNLWENAYDVSSQYVTKDQSFYNTVVHK